VILRDEDLLVDEPVVFGSDAEPLSDRCAASGNLRADLRLRHERGADAGQEHCDDHHERPPLIRAELSQRHSLLLLAFPISGPFASAAAAVERVFIGGGAHDVLTHLWCISPPRDR